MARASESTARPSRLVALPPVAVPLSLAAIVVAAVAVLNLALRHGIGVWPDSTQYLSTAQNLLAGRGLVVHWWDAGYVPFTHFPPLLPFLLQLIARLGVPLDQAATILNGASLVVTLVLVFVLVRMVARSDAAAIVAVALLAVTNALLQVHAFLLSEPPFIAFTAAALVLFVSADRTGSWMTYLAAGVLAGLATMTRYAGLPLVASGILVIVLSKHTAWATRLRQLAAFAIPSLSPLIIFVFFQRGEGTAANRELAFHPIQLWQVRNGVSSLAEWLIPPKSQTAWWVVLALSIAGAAALLVVIAIRAGVVRKSFEHVVQLRSIRFLALYAATYALFLLVSITFVDAQIDLAPRLLTPLLLPLLPIAAAILHDWYGNARLRSGTLILVGVVAVSAGVSTVGWLQRARRDGLGYASPRWRSSPLVKAVRTLPPEATIYSNRPDALLFLLGREAIGLPRLASPNSLRPNPEYAAEMKAICMENVRRRVILAVFVQEQDPFLPSIAELRQRLHSLPLMAFPDGVVDTVSAGCGA